MRNMNNMKNMKKGKRPPFPEAPSRKEVLEKVYNNWKPACGTEYVPIEQALGRYVAEDVVSENTLPVVRASAMDGVAVKSECFSDGIPDTSQWKYGIDYVRADTGDDFDDAFDQVFPIEMVEIEEAGIKFHFPDDDFLKRKNVRPQGSTIRQGEEILLQGTKVTPYRLAALATGGVKEVPVYKKPKIAFLPTGSELIPAGETPQRGQNIEANGMMIKALVEQWGGTCTCLPIVKDQMSQLEPALLEALDQADIVLIGGGSSKGSEDYSIPLIQKYGTVLQHHVASAPGRPMSVALIRNKLIINLPGPTLAAFAVADWAVHGVIEHWYGKKESLGTEVEAILDVDIKRPPFMEIYTRVIVHEEDGQKHAVPLERDARMVDGVGRCNGILVTQLGKAGYQAGEIVKIKLL